MTKKTKVFGTIALISALGVALGGPHLGFTQTSHASIPQALGAPRPFDAVEQAAQDEAGPIRLEAIVAADWEIDLEGLLNLEHPTAKAAGIENRKEPIQIKFYALHHPERGTFLIDTGVARSIARRTEDMPVGAVVRSAMNLDALVVHVDTKSWLERSGARLSGVFLTHLHLDHVLGLQDIPKDVPLYVGPGEASDSKFGYLFARGTTDSILAGFGPLRELSVQPSGSAEPGAVDVFGDGSLFGIHVPGHTCGSMAFLVRTTEGPALITGDASHTAWGWQHSVEPGAFNTDPAAAAASLRSLEELARARPHLRVHVGHQELEPAPTGVALH
jgi:N-acyl homoserine lactone hydrolase